MTTSPFRAIAIGVHAQATNRSISIGDYAVANDNELVIKIGSGEIRKKITDEEYDAFESLIHGARFFPSAPLPVSLDLSHSSDD